VVLRIGQRVPDFSVPDTNKQERKLSEFTQKGKTVLLFFPFAFSGVCDKEMCVFRDDMAKFNSLNAQTVGISVDSIFTLKIFAQTYNLQFPLLSDFNKKVSRAYGVLQEAWVAFGYKGVSKRAAFVLDGKGILRYKWVTDAPSNEPPYDEILSSLSKL
jgi:glutaredoxin-dependent peroxiredoxin